MPVTEDTDFALIIGEALIDLVQKFYNRLMR